MWDMSQQVANLHSFGPIVVAQKVVGGQESQTLDAVEDWQPPKSNIMQLK